MVGGAQSGRNLTFLVGFSGEGGKLYLFKVHQHLAVIIMPLELRFLNISKGVLRLRRVSAFDIYCVAAVKNYGGNDIASLAFFILLNSSSKYQVVIIVAALGVDDQGLWRHFKSFYNQSEVELFGWIKVNKSS